MVRPTKAHTDDVRRRLRQRLDDGFLRPGAKFLSNRALAARFGISYQTAHRLISELVSEGRLERRAASGTYVAGSAHTLDHVALLFHPRAQRPGSFGDHFLRLVTTALEKAGLRYEVTFSDSLVTISSRAYAVIWENPALATALARNHQYALLLNDRPPPGLAASYLDSVATDDFSGGYCAAELATSLLGPSPSAVVIAGPTSDGRSDLRVSGFRSLLGKASVFHAEMWSAEVASRVTQAVWRAEPDLIFCASDRLAEGVILQARRDQRACPPIIGFDDAPQAHDLNLTTIAIPWESLVSGAVMLIQRRIGGDTTTARQQIFAPRPVMRGSHLAL